MASRARAVFLAAMKSTASVAQKTTSSVRTTCFENELPNAHSGKSPLLSSTAQSTLQIEPKSAAPDKFARKRRSENCLVVY